MIRDVSVGEVSVDASDTHSALWHRSAAAEIWHRPTKKKEEYENLPQRLVAAHASKSEESSDRPLFSRTFSKGKGTFERSASVDADNPNDDNQSVHHHQLLAPQPVQQAATNFSTESFVSGHLEMKGIPSEQIQYHRPLSTNEIRTDQKFDPAPKDPGGLLKESTRKGESPVQSPVESTHVVNPAKAIGTDTAERHSAKFSAVFAKTSEQNLLATTTQPKEFRPLASDHGLQAIKQSPELRSPSSAHDLQAINPSPELKQPFQSLSMDHSTRLDKAVRFEAGSYQTNLPAEKTQGIHERSVLTHAQSTRESGELAKEIPLLSAKHDAQKLAENFKSLDSKPFDSNLHAVNQEVELKSPAAASKLRDPTGLAASDGKRILDKLDMHGTGVGIDQRNSPAPKGMIADKLETQSRAVRQTSDQLRPANALDSGLGAAQNHNPMQRAGSKQATHLEQDNRREASPASQSNPGSWTSRQPPADNGKPVSIGDPVSRAGLSHTQEKLAPATLSQNLGQIRSHGDEQLHRVSPDQTSSQRLEQTNKHGERQIPSQTPAQINKHDLGQIPSQTLVQTNKHGERQTLSQTPAQTNKHGERQIPSQTPAQTNKHGERQTPSQTPAQTNKHDERQTLSQTPAQTNKHGERQIPSQNHDQTNRRDQQIHAQSLEETNKRNREQSQQRASELASPVKSAPATRAESNAFSNPARPENSIHIASKLGQERSILRSATGGSINETRHVVTPSNSHLRPGDGERKIPADAANRLAASSHPAGNDLPGRGYASELRSASAPQPGRQERLATTPDRHQHGQESTANRNARSDPRTLPDSEAIRVQRVTTNSSTSPIAQAISARTLRFDPQFSPTPQSTRPERTLAPTNSISIQMGHETKITRKVLDTQSTLGQKTDGPARPTTRTNRPAGQRVDSSNHHHVAPANRPQSQMGPRFSSNKNGEDKRYITGLEVAAFVALAGISRPTKTRNIEESAGDKKVKPGQYSDTKLSEGLPQAKANRGTSNAIRKGEENSPNVMSQSARKAEDSSLRAAYLAARKTEENSQRIIDRKTEEASQRMIQRKAEETSQRNMSQSARKNEEAQRTISQSARKSDETSHRIIQFASRAEDNSARATHKTDLNHLLRISRSLEAYGRDADTLSRRMTVSEVTLSAILAMSMNLNDKRHTTPPQLKVAASVAGKIEPSQAKPGSINAKYNSKYKRYSRDSSVQWLESKSLCNQQNAEKHSSQPSSRQPQDSVPQSSAEKAILEREKRRFYPRRSTGFGSLAFDGSDDCELDRLDSNSTCSYILAAGAMPASNEIELPPLEITHAASGDINQPQIPQNTVLRRPSWLIKPNESLVSIAEEVYNDGRIAWLIADLNRGKFKETYLSGKRVIEIYSRERLELPVEQDIREFYQSLAKDTCTDNLVTIVLENRIDLDLVNSGLEVVLGSLGR